MHNNFKQTGLSVLLHPATLALPVALIFIHILPDVYDKYTIRLDHEKIHHDDSRFEYYDLDHDGISECNYVGCNAISGSAIVVHNQLGIVHHWDFKGKFLTDKDRCLVGDCDNNGKDEIYAFTYTTDSLLLNGIDYRNQGRFIIHNKLIIRIKRYNNEVDFNLKLITLTDLDGDRFKELVFATSTGYGVKPRRVYAYDIKRDSLYSSPELGGHIGPFDVKDINGDGFKEIAVSNYGPGNNHDLTDKMPDTCAYVLVLNNSLNFLFPPIPFPGKYNGIYSQFIRDGNRYLLATYWSLNSQLPGNPEIKIFDAKGKMLYERKFPVRSRSQEKNIEVIETRKGCDKLLLIPHYGNLSAFNVRLHSVRIPEVGNGEPGHIKFDFDQDGRQELLLKSVKPGEWIILRNSLKNPVTLKMQECQRLPAIFLILNKSEKPKFSLQLDEHEYVYKYSFNPLYYWKYPLYSGIYLSVFLFIMLIRYILKIQIKKKYEAEKRLTEMQLNAIHSQMDSHFTFNVINTIGSAILKENKGPAYILLTRFSNLLRSTLADSDAVTRKLSGELLFVRNFLEIQKTRFKNVFDYEIIEDNPSATDQLVPKGCIQTYVENSIKHGLSNRKSGGKITIITKAASDKLIITVEDNGIGRAATPIRKEGSTGNGINLMHQYYEILNRNNSDKITEEIIDLYGPEGKPAGTRVVITIPGGFDFGKK